MVAVTIKAKTQVFLRYQGPWENDDKRIEDQLLEGEVAAATQAEEVTLLAEADENGSKQIHAGEADSFTSIAEDMAEDELEFGRLAAKLKEDKKVCNFCSQINVDHAEHHRKLNPLAIRDVSARLWVAKKMMAFTAPLLLSDDWWRMTAKVFKIQECISESYWKPNRDTSYVPPLVDGDTVYEPEASKKIAAGLKLEKPRDVAMTIPGILPRAATTLFDIKRRFDIDDWKKYKMFVTNWGEVGQKMEQAGSFDLHNVANRFMPTDGDLAKEFPQFAEIFESSGQQSTEKANTATPEISPIRLDVLQKGSHVGRWIDQPLSEALLNLATGQNDNEMEHEPAPPEKVVPTPTDEEIIHKDRYELDYEEEPMETVVKSFGIDQATPVQKPKHQPITFNNSPSPTPEVSAAVPGSSSKVVTDAIPRQDSHRASGSRYHDKPCSRDRTHDVASPSSRSSSRRHSSDSRYSTSQKRHIIKKPDRPVAETLKLIRERRDVLAAQEILVEAGASRIRNVQFWTSKGKLSRKARKHGRRKMRQYGLKDDDDDLVEMDSTDPLGDEEQFMEQGVQLNQPVYYLPVQTSNSREQNEREAAILRKELEMQAMQIELNKKQIELVSKADLLARKEYQLNEIIGVRVPPPSIDNELRRSLFRVSPERATRRDDGYTTSSTGNVLADFGYGKQPVPAQDGSMMFKAPDPRPSRYREASRSRQYTKDQPRVSEYNQTSNFGGPREPRRPAVFESPRSGSQLRQTKLNQDVPETRMDRRMRKGEETIQLPEEYRAQDKSLIDKFTVRRLEVTLEKHGLPDRLQQRKYYSASGLHINLLEDPCFNLYMDKKLNGTKWISLGHHPVEAKGEAVFIKLSKDDPLAKLAVGLSMPDPKEQPGQQLPYVDVHRWSVIPKTVTSFPGPFYYVDSDRDHRLVKKFDTCKICGFNTHTAEECPLSVYLRRTLLMMRKKCFVCLRYYGRDRNLHVCLSIDIRSCRHCDAYGHHSVICGSPQHLKSLLRHNIFLSGVQMFRKESYTLHAYGISRADLRRYQEEYVVDAILHGRFIRAIGIFDDEKERAYRDVSAVVTEYDLMACGYAAYNQDLHFYENRVQYFQALHKTKLRPDDILQLKKLGDNWKKAPRADK